MQEIRYKLWHATRGVRPGAQRANAVGAGVIPVAHVPLTDGGDVRRLDVRASLADHWGRWMARRYRQNLSSTVWLLVDVSRSMRFGGEQSKLDVVWDIAHSFAYSARRIGDRYALVTFDEGVREDLMLPANRNPAAIDAVRVELEGMPSNTTQHAVRERPLLNAALRVSGQPGLVVLLSDLHFPLDEYAEALDALALHSVVPIVLWDELEWSTLPEFGWVSLSDAETGKRRTYWMRPTLKARWQEAYRERKEAILSMTRERGLDPVFMPNGVDYAALDEHFLA